MAMNIEALSSPYHAMVHRVAHFFGHEMTGEPEWLHPILHVVLIWAPLGLVVIAVVRLVSAILRRARASAPSGARDLAPSVAGLPGGVVAFVLRHSRRDQIALVAIGLIAMPVLYLALELPKIIINSAIGSDAFPVIRFGVSLTQVEYLFALCALYLLAISVNGALKFVINVHKGRVGERLLRRLRLTVFRRWREGAGGSRRSEVIPLIAQEVEPIGGFAADAFALPVFQGGTFITILIFMFVQDPILGAAAMTLLPVQLALIPRLQRRVNRLSRRRVAEVRMLGGELGDQGASDRLQCADIAAVGGSLRRIEAIRRDIHRSKYFIKSLNNFLTALTPFFFYAIGGYLVIEERLTLGALVAVLAAYKDFSAPLRELFRYYQTGEDVRIRYREMLRFLSGETGTPKSSAAPSRRPSLALVTKLRPPKLSGETL